MYPDDGDLEQRLARFEAQLDRFSLALRQWQHTQEHAQAATAPPDVDQRIKTLEETIDREAQAMRQLHEEPLKQLQAQTAILKEICAAAATSVQGLDQAESRLVAIQTDVQHHLGELSRSLQSLVADLRLGAGASTAMAPAGSAAAWPLERVVHLHDELRRTVNGDASAGSQGSPSDGRSQVFDHGALHEESGPGGIARRTWYIGGALVVAAGLLALGLVRRIETRLDDAGARMSAAEKQAEAATQIANREVVAARREADREIAEARQSAERAETVGAILTAPDLVRFNLTGGTAVERASAQVLWSRTRGLILSASRLPVAPADTTYQLWLMTNGAPVNAGVFVPDATGRASLVTSAPPRIASAVTGAEVTVEPSGGRTTPSGRPLLVRLP
jgi:hypothetical protein